ncbi:MAG: hypothetical protein IKC03_00145 [Oscillospiraceae bacterium]|nr:hypothetical protein [Oscillospiraceae bacterium]
MVDPKKGFKNKHTLIVDPEFESQIPPLTEEEFQQLEENILSDGVVLHPIVVWNDVIIDGHNRWRIIQKYPFLKYTIYEINFPDRYAALAWICRNQLGRRNLTPEQKKYLLGKMHEARKTSQGTNNRFVQAKSKKHQVDVFYSKDVAKQIAAEQGVGYATVQRAAKFARGVDLAEQLIPGMRQEILSGNVKLSNKKATELVTAAPKDQLPLLEKIRNGTKDDALSNNDEHKVWSSMLVEMTDALDSLIFRWEFCQTNNPTFFDDPDCQKEIRNLIRKGFDFINDYKGGLSPQ